MVFQCQCGLNAVLKTSWTDLNPGRRFWGCPLYKSDGRRRCNFLIWYDQIPCSRCNNIIPGLLRRIGNIEEAPEMSSRRVKRLFIALAMCLMFIAWCLCVSE